VTGDEAVVAMIDALNASSVPYMLAGSLSSNYVLITKLRWSQRGRRAKDAEDVRNVIAVQGDRLDWAYVCQWCDRHGTRELLEDLRRSIPPI
jgi:hypothetical protein